MAILVRSMTAMVFVVAVAGCAPGSKLKTVPVSGKVTFKGEPLSGATVAFVQESQAGQTAHPATGQTDAQGVYKLITFETPAKPIDGAVPGKYKVTVTKSAAAAGPANMMGGVDPAQMSEKMKNMSPEDMAKMGGQGAGVPTGGKNDAGEAAASLQAKSEIPERYSSPTDSKLEAEVKQGGPQTFNFDLKEEE